MKQKIFTEHSGEKQNIEPGRFDRERFSFEEEGGEPGWLISMSDLMSMLLVFFLVWTAVNMSEMERAKKTTDIKGPAVASRTVQTVPSSRRDRLYEFIPTGIRNNFVVVAFNRSEEHGLKREKSSTETRGFAHLVPVDMQVVSLE